MSNSKLNASIEAIKYIKPKIDLNSIIGVGTGSTVNYFIEELAKIKNLFKGAVSSSEASTQLLNKYRLLNSGNIILFLIQTKDVKY